MRGTRPGHRTQLTRAALPWYDFAELHWANDALWGALAKRLRDRGFGDVPSRLERGEDYRAIWARGELLFGQACGYDVVSSMDLQALAVPIYRAAGCEGPTYSSFLVVPETSGAVRPGDLRGGRAVINETMSHSGAVALRHLVAPHAKRGRFFACVATSGSHLRSLAMLARGQADVAAIDCVTHALLALHRPSALEGTRILATTEGASAPPFVSAAHASKERVHELRSCLFETLRAPETRAARDALLIEGAEGVSEDTFSRIREMCDEADALGYFEVPTCGGRQLRARP